MAEQKTPKGQKRQPEAAPQKARFIVMARWPTNLPGEPLELEGTRVECKTKRSAIGTARLLLDEVGVWQISITDLKNRPELREPAQQPLPGVTE